MTAPITIGKERNLLRRNIVKDQNMFAGDVCLKSQGNKMEMLRHTCSIGLNPQSNWRLEAHITFGPKPI